MKKKKLMVLGILIIILGIVGFVFLNNVENYKIKDVKVALYKDKKENLYYELDDKSIYLVNLREFKVTYQKETKRLKEWLDEDKEFMDKFIESLGLPNEIDSTKYYYYSYEDLIITNRGSINGNDVYIGIDFEYPIMVDNVIIEDLVNEKNISITDLEDSLGIQNYVEKNENNFKKKGNEGELTYRLKLNTGDYDVIIREDIIYIAKGNKALELDLKHSKALNTLIMKYVNMESFDKFEISKIVDVTKEMPNFSCDTGMELFYQDNRNSYYYSCAKSTYVIVRFKNGIQLPVKEALEMGYIKISDLDTYGIEYIKR